jgi:hypothetical protein
MVKLPDQAANKKIRLRAICLAEFLRGFARFQVAGDGQARLGGWENLGEVWRAMLPLYSAAWCCSGLSPRQFVTSLPKSENPSPNLVSSKSERPCSIVKLRSIIMERRMPPGTCKSCNLPIGDWHTEWLTTKDQRLLFRGEAGIDCPNCGASIMIPGAVVGGIAPSDKPMVRRSWQRVQFWATHAQTTPIDLNTYFQSPAGSLYKNYRFDP